MTVLRSGVFLAFVVIFYCERSLLFGIDRQLPTSFHLHTPWQPISVNFTLRIRNIFVINIVAVISNFYVVTVNKQPNNGIFFAIQFFSRTPKCPDSYPWGYAYPRLGINDIHDATCILNTNIQCSVFFLQLLLQCFTILGNRFYVESEYFT